MKFHKTGLDGVFLIELPRYEDTRWRFIRLFNDVEFKKTLWYKPVFQECYYSHSQKDVIRGMHFQTAPYAQDKFVYVISGKIRDVVLDIRSDSPSYWKYIDFELSEDNNYGLYIKKWFAHWFASLSNESIIGYMLSSWYSPEHDTWILYNSFWYNWGIKNPIVSEKDKIQSPFWDEKIIF